MALSINDKVSHANYEDYVTKHAHFEWVIDFENKVIHGTVTFKLTNISKNKSKLKLDCKYLNVLKVKVQNCDVNYQLFDGTVDALGKCLSIPIDCMDDEITVTIKYATMPEGSALQWLPPQATKGKKHPYLFSQCEAILARQLFPCQDTPGVKFTYSAEVRADRQLNVLMGAVKNVTIVEEGKNKVHKFEQKVPIPSYLVAIVCGNLEGRKIGPRSTVWSEPEMVDEAAKEFEDTEKFILTGEELCGPYVWGIYDVLVLPPSFPYGGMENPCLTFVTPTLLVGDKSLVYVVAHEIAHSWTGNLVTNKTWDDFWLNEGHTMYLESLIMERHYKSEPMRHLLLKNGLTELEESLKNFGEGHQFNQLVGDFVEIDPDEAWSFVPYEKGQQLLVHIETKCGKEKMLRWLKAYVKRFQYKSLNTKEWKEFLYEYMMKEEHVERDILDGVEWEEWFKGRWKVPVESVLGSELADSSDGLASRWCAAPQRDAEQHLLAEYESLTAHQRYYFLQSLNNVIDAKMEEHTMEMMGRLYGFNESTNSEILWGWSMLCIRSRYTVALDTIFAFLNSQGRLRYTRPIYKALYEWPDLRQRTIDNFQSTRSALHPTTAGAVVRILHLAE